ncbi:putative exo-alpha-sialidase [Halogeometricum pallidum JCM 14848]|uniref:Putative exo-alpha-sialidase n=1 Tax=Halogeometricum pallidum JCM 14848 TaxID=1227487 RepID=M0D7D2_HALPD|nr:COG1361 S-layer family protein [Halogeometricum pallidum]ELZ31406.1 putative exo-alpha-sialidase [Halogeometricum pallidum JCM 14848]
MNRRQLLALIFVSLIVVPGTVGAAVRGSPDLKVALGDNRVAVGESGTLELTVANSGDLDLASATNPALNERVTTARGIELSLDDGDAPLTVESGPRLVGGLASGQSATVGFDVSVDADAEPGTYTLPVTVEYTHTSSIAEVTGGITERTVERELTVTVIVEDTASFRVVETTTDAQVGESGSVSLLLENTGAAPADDATVTLSSPNGAVAFSGAQEATRYVGSWGPDETRTVTYDVAVDGNRTPQNYAAQAVVSYLDSDGNPKNSQPLSVGIDPRPETAFSVPSLNASLYVGERGTLRGSVVNEGPERVRGAVVTLRTDSEHIRIIDDSVAVGTLEPGERADVEFSAAVSDDATPGARPFSLTVEYEPRAGSVTGSDPIRVTGQVRPERDLFGVEARNATFAPDSTNRLEVVVTNTGETTRRDVVLALEPSQPFTSVAPEAYVPALSPGESATVAFELSVDEDAVPSTHSVRLNVTAETAETPTEVTDSYRVRVDVAEEEQADDIVSLVVIAVLGAVLLSAVGYWWYRRR